MLMRESSGERCLGGEETDCCAAASSYASR